MIKAILGFFNFIVLAVVVMCYKMLLIYGECFGVASMLENVLLLIGI